MDTRYARAEMTAGVRIGVQRHTFGKGSPANPMTDAVIDEAIRRLPPELATESGLLEPPVRHLVEHGEVVVQPDAAVLQLADRDGCAGGRRR